MQVALCVELQIHRSGTMQSDKYSFRFTKLKGNSDSFPILRTFAAYFKSSLLAATMTKPKKFQPAILSSPNGTGILGSLNLKVEIFFLLLK